LQEGHAGIYHPVIKGNNSQVGLALKPSPARHFPEPTMNDPDTPAAAELTRFYKLDKAGRWHRKSSGGAYIKMNNRRLLKRLLVITTKSVNRIE
jgi:hypothetical protein